MSFSCSGVMQELFPYVVKMVMKYHDQIKEGEFEIASIAMATTKIFKGNS